MPPKFGKEAYTEPAVSKPVEDIELHRALRPEPCLRDLADKGMAGAGVEHVEFDD